MRLGILGATLAALVAAGCVYHYEKKAAAPRPEDRMEFSAQSDTKHD